MNPEETAVVLIEYQNDFTSEGGTLHEAVKPVMENTNMLANTVDMVKKARALVSLPPTVAIAFHSTRNSASEACSRASASASRAWRCSSSAIRSGNWSSPVASMCRSTSDWAVRAVTHSRRPRSAVQTVAASTTISQAMITASSTGPL